jgi:hypothetical protein
MTSAPLVYTISTEFDSARIAADPPRHIKELNGDRLLAATDAVLIRITIANIHSLVGVNLLESNVPIRETPL